MHHDLHPLDLDPSRILALRIRLSDLLLACPYDLRVLRVLLLELPLDALACLQEAPQRAGVFRSLPLTHEGQSMTEILPCQV